MNQEHLHRLLAGYATGQLSDGEKKQLFAAALDNQELFDQLMAEDSLREVLELPGARGRLLAALESAPAPASVPLVAALVAPSRRRLWFAWAAAVAVISFSGVITFHLLRAPAESTQVAEVRTTSDKPQAPAYQPPPPSEPAAKPSVVERPPDLADKSSTLPSPNIPLPTAAPPPPPSAAEAPRALAERDAAAQRPADFRRRESAELAAATNEIKKERLDTQPRRFDAGSFVAPRAQAPASPAALPPPPAKAAESESKVAAAKLASTSPADPPRIWRRRADGVWVRLLPNDTVARNETLSLRWTPSQSGVYTLSAAGLPPAQILTAAAGRELDIPISPAWLSAAPSGSLTLTLSPGSPAAVGAVSSLRESAAAGALPQQPFQIILRIQ